MSAAFDTTGLPLMKQESKAAMGEDELGSEELVGRGWCSLDCVKRRGVGIGI